MKVFRKIGIVGAGRYGTALAQCFSVSSDPVTLISISENLAHSINQLRMHYGALPGIKLNSSIACRTEFTALKDCDVIFIAVPVTAVESVCYQIKSLSSTIPVVSCSKGFDTKNNQLLGSLIKSILSNEIAIFSGPSFAREIAEGLHAGVNIASDNYDLACKLAADLTSGSFRVTPIQDAIGLQVAGAMKNILAVGCGIFSGLKMGDSAISQLIVNGTHEMIQLATALGGCEKTFMELGGIGDIILTCTSAQSRNVSFGKHIAQGGKLSNWEGDLTEGAFAMQAIPAFSQKNNLSLPIFNAIYNLVYKDAQDSIQNLIQAAAK